MAKVYVLGAGASKALNDKAPTMSELNERVFHTIQSGGKKRLERLRTFLNDFYAHLPADEIVPLQEVLTLLDTCINDNRPLTQQYSIDTLRNLQEDFIYVISLSLKESLGASPVPNDQTGQEDRSKTVQPFLNSLQRDDSIITLNYDLILDNRIAEGLFHQDIYASITQPVSSQNNDVNYGFQPRFALTTAKRQRAYRPYPFVPLYKLHGSLNWLYCPACREVDVSLGQKGLLHYALERSSRTFCRWCGVRYEPLLVTPTLLKSYSNLFIANIWRDAETRLTQADKIIFVGYSMPDADSLLRAIFARSIFRNRTLNGRLPEIVVVDEAQAAENDVEQRYRHIFGDITYYSQGFLRYIADEIASPA